MDVLTRPAPPPVHLTGQERCDRCGAQAYVHATLPSDAVLLFCGHHGRVLGERLVRAGARLHDETARLVARPTGA